MGMLGWKILIDSQMQNKKKAILLYIINAREKTVMLAKMLSYGHKINSYYHAGYFSA